MKKTLVSATATILAFSAGAVFAADFPLAKSPPAAPSQWRGFYNDANAAGAWATRTGFGSISAFGSSDIARDETPAAEGRANRSQALDETRRSPGGSEYERQFARAFFDGANAGGAFGARRSAAYVGAFPLSQARFDDPLLRVRAGASDRSDRATLAAPAGTRY